MASIYRPTYTRPLPKDAEILNRRSKKVARWRDRKGKVQIAPLASGGKRIILTYKCWYIAYKSADGTREIVKGYTDRESTEQRGRELEKLAARKREGLQIIDPDKYHTAFSEALDLYVADLRRARRDDMYIYNIQKRMKKLARECGWPTVVSVRSDDFVRWLSAPAQSGRAPRTLNQYLATASAFMEWCISPGKYLIDNPLKGIPRCDESDKRRVRRGLPEADLGKLLDKCEERSVIYLTAIKTGLRKDELRKLQWGDVELEGERPYIRLRGTCNKARREDLLPLDTEVAAALRDLRPTNAKATDLVFPGGMPKIETYKGDLERAGIPYLDEQGRQADFHALRMSYNMLLARKGVPPGVAMQLMRHTDIRLTTKVYTDVKLLDLQGAVEKLPTLRRPDKRKSETAV
jgi:integrase